MADSHLAACATAEAEVDRLGALLQDHSTASEADNRDNQLTIARQQIEDLRIEVAQIKQDAAEAEDDHRQITVALRATQAAAKENEKALLARQLEIAEQLEKKESDLQIVSTALATKEDEVAALVEAVRRANETAASAAAAASAGPDSSTSAPDAVSSFSPSQLELEGIQRLQDAVARLRAERDGLRSEQDELRLSLSFSVSAAMRVIKFPVSL